MKVNNSVNYRACKFHCCGNCKFAKSPLTAYSDSNNSLCSYGNKPFTDWRCGHEGRIIIRTDSIGGWTRIPPSVSSYGICDLWESM